MKRLFILSFIAMLIVFNVGCSLFVNEQEKTTKAGVESQEVQKDESTKADNYVIEAKQSLSSGNYAKAINEATAAIKANANNAEAYSIRGFATALNGDTAKGLVDTKRPII